MQVTYQFTDQANCASELLCFLGGRSVTVRMHNAISQIDNSPEVPSLGVDLQAEAYSFLKDFDLI
jgi:hypothetical protein